MSEKKKGFFAEFKEFITKGNVISLAVGVIIGSAFTAITTSLVNDILMPIVSLVKPDGFTGMYLGLIKNGELAPEGGFTLANGAIIEAGEPLYRAYIYYGNFIQAVINFLLIAFVLFMIVRTVNRVNRKLEEASKAIKEKFDDDKEVEVK